jgi:NAD(P)-dependent dehydrogenase (short-subunit alcohol dehydrogenase family)
MASFVFNLLKSQYLVSLPYPETSFEGKTVIVTGANTGLGFEAARHITRLGASRVIIACRTAEKGEAAKKSIEESTNRTGVIEVWELDLCSYSSVKEFAAQLSQLERLDVLLENAGVSTQNFAVAEENETTITTNVVSTFLLGLLALPKLKETASKYNTTPHLVIVSSEVHHLSNLPERNDASGSIFTALNDKSKAQMMQRYNVSKLLEVLAVRQIVEDHAPAGYPVVINYLNPGFCHSELMREASVMSLILKTVFHARSTEVGSRTLVHAAHAGTESHGQYLSDCKVSDPSKFVMSQEGKKAQGRVWKELSEKLETIQPGILKNF